MKEKSLTSKNFFLAQSRIFNGNQPSCGVGFTVSPLELLKEDNERKGERSSTVFHRNGNKQTLTFKKKDSYH